MIDSGFVDTVRVALDSALEQYKDLGPLPALVNEACSRSYATTELALDALQSLQSRLVTEYASRKISLPFLDIVLQSKIDCLRVSALVKAAEATQAPRAEDEIKRTFTGPDGPLEAKRRCRVGLQNHIADQTLNKCYLYACLKGMYLTPGLRRIVESTDKPIAICLRKIFQMFDSKQELEKVEVLPFFDERLQELITAVAKDHPEIQEPKQFDASEFLSWVIGDAPFITYEERKERDTDDATRICIPNIDLPKAFTEIFIPIHIPPSKERVDLQEEFRGRIVAEPIDPEAIRRAERNQGHEAQVSEALHRLGPTLPVLQHKRLRGAAAPCLILQLNRPLERLADRAKTMTEKELRGHVDASVADLPPEELRSLVAQTPPTKIDVEVNIPSILTVPGDDCDHQYEYCCTVVHLGKTEGKQGGGHYIAMEPSRAADEHGFRHDDETIVLTDRQIAVRLIEHDGYLVFYTLKR